MILSSFGQRSLCSDEVDAQTDLSLHRADKPSCIFFCAQLILVKGCSLTGIHFTLTGLFCCQIAKIHMSVI